MTTLPKLSRHSVIFLCGLLLGPPGLMVSNLLADTCVSPPSGMVGWWRAENNALDTSASTNTGTLSGNATFGPGRVGQSFVFDGNGDGVSLGNPAILQLQNFTIEGWIKRSSATVASQNTPDGNCLFLSCGYGGYGFGMFNDGRLFLTRVGIDNVQLATPSVVDTNWHHVAVTKSGTTVFFYMDGAAIPAPVYSTGYTFNNAIAIGARGDDMSSSFLGAIDEMAVYNRALSTNEIRNIYITGSAGKCIVPTVPFIIVQPANQGVEAGDGASFNVLADGTQPLNFQWKFNGTNIIGATNLTLNLVNVQPSVAGSYSVEITNIVGTTISSNASLTVNPAPSCAPLTSNLVSWWRAEGDALDFAGGNNGILTNNTTFGVGRAALGFVFDGNEDAVRLGNPINLQLQNFTIEGWIKRASPTISTTAGAGNCLFLSYGSGGYGFGMFDDGHMFLTRVAVDNVQLPTPKVADTGWHHVAVTKTGTNVFFYIDGIAYSVPAYSTTYSFSTPVAIGARGDNLTSGFYGSIDELAVYSRALSTNEIQTIYNARASGKCAVPIAPYIVSQPTNRTVLLGSNTIFSATVAGSPTLLYQWSLNGTNIAGATNTSLTLTNVQFNQAGNYAVAVTNGGGFAASSNALLSVVFPPAVVRVISVSGMAGTTVAVPVQLLANGNENALGFSLSYNTNLLAFNNVVLGGGAGGAALIPNVSQTASGKVGVALALNSGSVFALGTQEVAVVNFAVVAPPSASNQTASVTFTDVPTTRQLVDAAAGNLAAYYTNGTVTITASDWEGDTAPRTNGNKQVLIEDWVQVGRFVAKLDVPNDGSEYQRADCAPRATLGNGILSITDWVQAGRYAAGLDPLTVVGGPTTEDTNAVPLVGGGKFQPKSVGRTLRVASRTVQAAVTNTVTVQLDALGNENAVGFSLNFNPAILQFVSASLGADAGNALSNLNTSAIGSGKLGVALALSTGVSWPAGTRELLKVNFAVAASATGTSNVAFGSNPIAAEISDAAANTLTATYASGVLTFSPYPPVLRANLAETNAVVAWPVVASNFVLQVNADPAIASSNWSNASENPAVIGEEKIVTITNITGTKFFRLYKP